MLAGSSLAAGCAPSAEERAAERAIDACIEALAPVADGRTPAPAALASSVADAEDAARADDRWDTLAARLRRLQEAAGSPAEDAAVDALVAECERSSRFVRRGGQEQREA